MAIMQSGASADLLTIDPTSKAARVTLYDSGGNEVQAPPLGSYMLPINIRQTAATAANATVWAMRNGVARTISIRRLSLNMSFDGTLAATTTPRYGVQRFTTATPTAGTVLTPVKKRTSYSASGIADARFLDTGLTVTSVVFEPDMMVFGLPISVTGAISMRDYIFERSGERYDSIELAPNEGICIRLSTVTVLGIALNGFITWDER